MRYITHTFDKGETFDYRVDQIIGFRSFEKKIQKADEDGNKKTITTFYLDLSGNVEGSHRQLSFDKKADREKWVKELQNLQTEAEQEKYAGLAEALTELTKATKDNKPKAAPDKKASTAANE